jgi:perosamine synthetase
MNVRLFTPSVGDEELNEIKESFERSWIGLGPKVNKLEKQWADFVGVKTAIALNSATAALHLAVKSFNFEKGKKILVPSMTFSATASAILYEGLIPVFVDSSMETLGMDLNDLKNKYDEECVAVMPVHFCGHPVEMDKLVPWAREKGLKIIEDCAHTSGSLYKGKPLGAWGDIGCFSFEEKKLMTTGDGGMIVSNDEDLLKDVKAMRWVGIDKDNWKTAQSYLDVNKDAYHWFYELNILGYKYNMNDLAASIGLVQLKKLPEMNKKRSSIIDRYVSGIEKCRTISPIVPYETDNYVYQMFGVRTEHKEDLILYLKSNGIATGCHYTPLTLQPLFKPYASPCDVAENEYEKMLTLPLHCGLTEEEVNYVIKHLNEFENQL